MGIEIISPEINAVIQNYRNAYTQVQEVVRFIDDYPTGVGFLQLITLDGLHTHFYTLKKDGAKVILERQPVLHCIGELKGDSRDNFVSIMGNSNNQRGFVTPATVENASVHANGIPDKAYYGLYADPSRHDDTHGDRYALELYENTSHTLNQNPILVPGGSVYPIAINVQETPISSIRAIITIKHDQKFSAKISTYQELFTINGIPIESCSFLIIKENEDGTITTEAVMLAQDLFDKS